MVMIKNKNAKVASISFIARSVKLLAAPITLLIISKQLSSEELAFYYTFFSLVSMQQLAELGIGHTIKQYISHAYRFNNNDWDYESKKEIKGYFYLSLYWFIGVSLFILCFVGFAGYYYLNLSNSNINWLGAWISLVIVSAIATQITPIILVLDATQRQVSVQKANLFSSIASSMMLWICLSLNLGLYSIAISSAASLIITYCTLFRKILKIKYEFDSIEKVDEIKTVFYKIFPLLSKVFIVWGFGFLFWNSFSLISFKVFSESYTGELLFSLSLAQAGMSMVCSINKSQVSALSNLISCGEIYNANRLFFKYSIASIIILVLGYSLFFLIWEIMPNLYVFDKVVDKFTVLQMFVFFLLVTYKTIRNDFIRCYKVEPFVKCSIVESILLPLVYYFSCLYFREFSFLICSFLIFCILLWSVKIEKKYLLSNKLISI